MRKLPYQEPRVETGPVRFGEDWPGLFIRGDECLDLKETLQCAIDQMAMAMLGSIQLTRLRYYITLCNEAITDGRSKEPEGR